VKGKGDTGGRKGKAGGKESAEGDRKEGRGMDGWSFQDLGSTAFAFYTSPLGTHNLPLECRGGSCRDAGQQGANPGHPGKSGRVKYYINVVIYLPRTKLHLRTRK